jgi:hypothetical protein
VIIDIRHVLAVLVFIACVLAGGGMGGGIGAIWGILVGVALSVWVFRLMK